MLSVETAEREEMEITGVLVTDWMIRHEVSVEFVVVLKM